MNRAFPLYFILLFAAFLIKPANFPDVSKLYGATVYVLLASAGLLTLRSSGILSYFKNYPVELALLLSFTAWSALTALVKIELYPTPATLVFSGFGQTSLILLLALVWAALRHSVRRWDNLFLSVLITLHTIAIAQWLNYGPPHQLLTYTLAADALQSGEITSLFRWHTVYATVAAFSLVYCAAQLSQGNNAQSTTIFLLILLILSASGGLFSSSRNFMLTSIVGLIVLGITRFRTRPKILLTAAAGFAVLFHVVILLSPTLSVEYGKSLPYFHQLLVDKRDIQLQDFVPSLSDHALSGRLGIWRRGLELWGEEKWLGIGPGVFNLQSGFSSTLNLHNVYLEILVGSGVLGFVLFVLLVLTVLWRSRHSAALPIWVAALASLLFDNFLAYSAPWVLCLAWFLLPRIPEITTSP